MLTPPTPEKIDPAQLPFEKRLFLTKAEFVDKNNLEEYKKAFIRHADL